MPFRAFRRRLVLPLAIAALAIPTGETGSAFAQAPCTPAPASAVEEAEEIWDEGLHPAGDLDGDGRPDALHVSETSLTGVRGHDGATLWTSPGAVDSVYRAGDLDGVAGADPRALCCGRARSPP
jgi:hypothetical protein